MSSYSNFVWRMALLLGLFAVTVATSCRKDDAGDPQPGCDNTRPPVVMVHGFLASGDTYARQAQRFAANSYCNERVFVFDWNTVANNQAAALTQLNAFVDSVLELTQSTQIDLVGHSAGGGLCYTYLSDGARAAKVAHYAHLGSGPQASPAGPGGSVPTLNVWSEADQVVAGADIAGATNVKLSDQDHYQAATSEATFAALFRHFNDGKAPQQLTPAGKTDIQLAGRVVSLGENLAKPGSVLEIYEVDPVNGERLRTLPEARFTIDTRGYWGPFEAKSGVHYEFYVVGPDPGDRPVHYYREPFTTDDYFVYLRQLPPPTSTAGLLLSALPSNDAQTVAIVFTSTQAVIAGRDELSINDAGLATEQYASATRSTIAYFIYDDGNDRISSGNVPFLFTLLNVFLTGVDYFIPAQPNGDFAQLRFNGRTLNVPALPSAAAGVVVAVFD